MSKSAQRKSSRNVPTEKPLLSVCITALGDQTELERCIRSIARLADEIIVANTGSDNDLADIASRHSVVLVNTDWQNDFSRLRNLALDHATGQWVLALESDEWLQPNTVNAIKKAIESQSADAFRITIRNIVGAPEWNECFLKRSCRLFRNNPAYRFARRACETIEPSIEQAGGRIGSLDRAQINHDGYSRLATNSDSKILRRIRILQEEIEQDPTNEEQLYNLGSEYYSQGDFYHASECLAKASDLTSDKSALAPMIYSLLIVSLRELGLPKEGIQAALIAEQRGIASAELSFARAWAYMALKQYADAAHYFELSLKQSENPKSRKTVSDPTIQRYRGSMGLALALLESAQAEEALPHALKAVEGCHVRPEPWVLLGCVHQLRGQKTDALAALEKALELEPYHPDALGLAIPLYQETGQSELALPLVERLLQDDPESPWLLIQRAGIHLDLSHFDQALMDADSAVEASSGSVDILMEAGKIKAYCSDYKGALRCFELAITLRPNDPALYFNTGDILYRLGHYDHAAEMYSIGVDFKPDYAAGFFALGNAYIKSGHLEAAIKSWERAVDINPDYAEALNNLEIARKTIRRAA